MTNDVEQLIIDGKTQVEINYSDSIAYLFYKEIWKFILYSRKYNFDFIKISFKMKYDGNYYIRKADRITFEGNSNDYYSKWAYHDGTRTYDIDRLFNTNINFDLLVDLINSDDFEIKKRYEDNEFLVNIIIEKEKIEKVINNTLLKNKCLKNKRLK